MRYWLWMTPLIIVVCGEILFIALLHDMGVSTRTSAPLALGLLVGSGGASHAMFRLHRKRRRRKRQRR